MANLRPLLFDVNGKLSSKRFWGSILIINSLSMAWFALLSAQGEVLGPLIALVSSGVTLLTATVAERKAPTN